MSRSAVPPVVALAALVGTTSCVFNSNDPPETVLVAGAVDEGEGSYRLSLEWSGTDPDGEISHFEISWNNADAWERLTGTQGEFTLYAGDCCGTPPPDGSTFETWAQHQHEFYLRAVDDEGAADPTPEYRRFTAKTIVPWSGINIFPDPTPLRWKTRLIGQDDDGTITRYQYALLSRDEWIWSGNADVDGEPGVFATIDWFKTLDHHVQADGSPDLSRPLWIDVDPGNTDVTLPLLSEFNAAGNQQTYYLFTRALDNAGAVEEHFEWPRNFRHFTPRSDVGIPRLDYLWSETRVWDGRRTCSFRPPCPGPANLFAGETLNLQWKTDPGEYGLPAVEHSYRLSPNSTWSPWSQGPATSENWTPGAGTQTIEVRFRNELGLVGTSSYDVNVARAFTDCTPGERSVLVIVDHWADGMEDSAILPVGSETIVRTLAEEWFSEYNAVFIQPALSEGIPMDLLDCTGAIVVLHGGDVSDYSWLESRSVAGVLDIAGLIDAGGHVLVLGTNVTAAARHHVTKSGAFSPPAFPVTFEEEPPTSDALTHWFRKNLGISRVDRSVGNTYPAGSAPDRLSVARSAVPGYPDLAFDPLTWPNGPIQRGFGYYDDGVHPVPGQSEVIYTRDDTGIPIGVRTLDGKGVFLGLHPYFVDRSVFQELIHTIMADFGEIRTP